TGPAAPARSEIAAGQASRPDRLLPPATQRHFDRIHSGAFLRFLSRVTGIKAGCLEPEQGVPSPRAQRSADPGRKSNDRTGARVGIGASGPGSAFGRPG